MSSDHLIVDLGDHPVAVGDEITFGVGYGALVRAMTSPFVTKIEHLGRSVAPEVTQVQHRYRFPLRSAPDADARDAAHYAKSRVDIEDPGAVGWGDAWAVIADREDK